MLNQVEVLHHYRRRQHAALLRNVRYLFRCGNASVPLGSQILYLSLLWLPRWLISFSGHIIEVWRLRFSLTCLYTLCEVLNLQRRANEYITTCHNIRLKDTRDNITTSQQCHNLKFRAFPPPSHKALVFPTPLPTHQQCLPHSSSPSCSKSSLT